MRPETVIINGDNGPVMINKSDYDPEQHTLADGMPEILQSTTALTPAAPVGTDANGNPVNPGDGGQFVPQQQPAADSTDNGGQQQPAADSTDNGGQQQPAADSNSNDAPPVLLVTKNDRKKFIVVDMEQKPFVAEGIDADGYKTEKDAWEAVNAFNTARSGQQA